MNDDIYHNHIFGHLSPRDIKQLLTVSKEMYASLQKYIENQYVKGSKKIIEEGKYGTILRAYMDRGKQQFEHANYLDKVIGYKSRKEIFLKYGIMDVWERTWHHLFKNVPPKNKMQKKEQYLYACDILDILYLYTDLQEKMEKIGKEVNELYQMGMLRRILKLEELYKYM